MHTARRGLVGAGAGDVARCGAVLVGPADGAVAPCGDWWARLLVGAAFRHRCAVGGGRPPEEGVLPAFVRRPAGALLADLAASPDDGARGAGAALGRLAADERAWDAVAARAADLLARVDDGGALGAAPGAAAVPRVPVARAGGRGRGGGAGEGKIKGRAPAVLFPHGHWGRR